MKLAYKPLLKFMLERHRIYLRRQAGAPAPWTDDPILDTYKFTNCFRELDRVTIWIRENIREPFAEHPHLWFMLCIARQINWPPTLRALMEGGGWPTETEWDWRRAMRVMRSIAKRGEKVYTGAYMLTANGGGLLNKVPGKFDKPELTCKLVLNGVWKARAALEPTIHSSLQGAVGALNGKHVGFGGFMAYEVACDLRYTRYLRDAPDKLTWAHAGPGAKRGLNRLLGKGAKERPFLSDKEAVDAMVWLLGNIQTKWPREWPALELREIEHSLCEYSKWVKAVSGEGHLRSRYTPYENRGETW